MRQAQVTRNTLETRITVKIDLDGTGKSVLSTGIGFFDHMLDQVARHGMLDLEIAAQGDLHIDAHHTVEDVGITLGAKANPPGFDAQLLGLEIGATRSFTIQYPADYAITELQNTTVDYTATVKGIKRRVVPELDDEFAKDLGQFENLDALFR